MGKIAIIRRDGYGDLLHTYPLILFLKKNVANWITLFVSKGNVELIKYLPSVDEVICFPEKGNKYLNVLSTVWKAKQGFDLAISGKTSPMKLMNFALFVSGAKKKRAYVDNNWHGRLVNSAVEYHEKIAALHQAVKGLKLVVPHLDFLPDELIPRISLSLEQYSSELPWHQKNFTLCISASTTRDENRLDPLRYARLCNAFHKKNPCQVVLLGLGKDRARAEHIAEHLEMPHRVVLPSFDQMMVHLWLADLLLVGDGGLSHIRAAMDKPSLVLFGQTHPNLWHPMSKKTRCLFHSESVNLLGDPVILSALEKVWQINECNNIDGLS